MATSRREFLQQLAAAGIASWSTSRPLAASDRYQGPLWLTLAANGGWDLASLFDPRAAPVTRYPASAIEQQGPFAFGPYRGPPRAVADPSTGREDRKDFFGRFFARYASRLCTIGGIDIANNSHVIAKQYTWGGRLESPLPAFAALAAAASRPDLAMAFISTGDYEFTADQVGTSRPRRPALATLGHANQVDPARPASGTFQRPEIWDRLVRPRMRAALRAGGDEPAHQLATLQASDLALADFGRSLPGDWFRSQQLDAVYAAQTVLAAFRAGLAVGANITMEGFDTHSNHDALHYPLLDDLLRTIDFIMQGAERLGIADRLTLVVGSEFSRTPYYNEFGGKDHWPVGALMAMGPSIAGGRKVGGTSEESLPLRLDPLTLAPSPTGVVLTPRHVHAALHQLAGIGPPWAPRQPSPVLDLFGSPARR